jgi:hypothetical protein
MMKTRMMVLALAATLSAAAGQLPQLQEPPWLGCWIANDQNNFDYKISALGGEGILYPKISKREGYVYAGIHDRFQFIFILEELVRGKWTRRKMSEDGFETDQEPSAKVKECEFVAAYQGGSKARIRHRFERGKIVMSTEVVHEASDNPLRVGVMILTPGIHGVLKHQKVPSEDEIAKIMKGDEIRAARVDGKRLKFGLHEVVNLSAPELLGEGAEDFSLNVKRFGGKPIIFSSAVKGGGKMFFQQEKRLFESYRITWYPAENKKPAEGAELVIDFK